MIVLYDGECVFCHRSVQFIIRRDPDRSIRFASLSDEQVAATVARRLAAEGRTVPDSLIVIEQGRIYTHSSAALRIARRLGGLWQAAYPLILVPRLIRDAVYRLIAANRHRILGKVAACPLPDPDMRSRLIPPQEVADTLASSA